MRLRLLTALCALSASALAAEPHLSRIADNAFAGSSINVVANIRQSVCTHGDTQFVAFYDADGFMVLARRALNSDTWETLRTPHRGNIADAHNSISLIIDGDGFLHVSWDHHGNPLNYARSVAPGSLELAPKSPMTGERENNVTYPQFFAHPSGDLLFLYRDGRSGQGSLVLNRYDLATKTWHTVQPNLIDGEGKRSPYWAMTIDRTGTLHLAWNWRDSPDVATNHDLAYARSTDSGVTWTRTDGSSQSLPIIADNAEYAARISQKSNLMNPPFITTDTAGNPAIVSYWSPESEAAPQFQILRYDGKSWRIIPGPARTEKFSLAGTGTKRPPISRALLLFSSSAKTPANPALHLIYRDDSRAGRIIHASLNDQPDATWRETELTPESVGAWEPSFDPAAWEKFQQLHMLVQTAQQRDGNDRNTAATPASPVSVLSWTP
ncbi:MAG: BNR repeat-containing protein [Nibricoccus sp.]